MNRTFAVTAVAIALAGVAAVPSVAQKKGRAISIAAEPNPITWDQSTTISGKLTGPNSSGQTVELQRNAFPLTDNKFVDTGQTTTTAQNGTYSFTAKPKSHSEYRVEARPSPPVRSAPVLVRVRKKVSFRVNTTHPDRGQKVKFYGRVCPPHDGGIAKVQRRTDEGKWESIRKMTLQDDPKVANCSRYKLYVTVKSDGVFRVLALKDADHSIGKSTRRSLEIESD